MRAAASLKLGISHPFPAQIEGAGVDVVFRRLDFAGFRDGDGMDYVALVLDAAALTVEDCVFRDRRRRRARRPRRRGKSPSGCCF